MRKSAAVLDLVMAALLAAALTPSSLRGGELRGPLGLDPGVPGAESLIRRLNRDDGGAVRVIIELRAQPLLVRADGAVGSAAQRRRQIDAQLDRLESDLGRIAGGGVVAESATIAPRLHRRYTLAFAGASARVPAGAIPEIAKLDYVARVYRDLPVEAYLQESVPRIGAPEVWEKYGTRGAGVTVAIIDTGIDYTHDAFGGTFGPGSRVKGGFDFVNDDADPIDDNGHGTHVAGIVGGNGGGVVGVAPDVSLLAYKVLDSGGGGFESDIIAAIEKTVDPNGDGDPSDHADVANMSLGAPFGGSNDPDAIAVNNATMSGVLFVIAAGNSGRFFGVGSPGVATSALTVGASNRDDDGIAPFTSRGPIRGTGALKPEVVAPGVGIVSSWLGNTVREASGTSMAAPHVAGVAALMKAVHPSFSPAQIKSAIVDSAVMLDSEVMESGAGRVDAAAAADLEVIAQPSVIGFGVDDLAAETWQTFQQVRLQNLSKQDLTLAVSTTGTDANIVMTVEPSSVFIPARGIGTVTVRLSVANAAFPTPKQGSLSFGGHLILEGDGARLHFPWAFVKAAVAHVRFPANEGYDVLFTSDESWFEMFMTAPSDAILPPADYEVVAQSFDPLLIILEKQPIQSKVNIDLDSSAATTAISFQAVDENGQTLDQPDRNCKNEEMLILPDGSAIRWWAMGQLSGSLHISPVSSRYTLLPEQICWSPTDMWVAQYDPITELDKDIVSTLTSDRWITQPVRIDVPAGWTNPFLERVGLLAWRSQGINGYGGWVSLMPLDAGQWHGVLHFTEDVYPDAGGAVAMLLLADPPDSTHPPGDGHIPTDLVFESPFLRRIGNVISPASYQTRDPLSYVPLESETLRFANGVPAPAGTVGVSGETISIGAYWTGSLGEFRDDLTFQQQQTTITSPSGAITTGSGYSQTVPFEEGIYAFESRVPLTLDDAPAQDTMTMRIDTRQLDYSPPRLTALRIVDADERSSTRILHKHGSLRFSVLDYRRDAEHPDFYVAPIEPGLTHVWGRMHGTDAWQEIAVTHETDDIGSVGELGHAPIGSVFRADLSNVTSSLGLVDLRIEVSDPAGNSIELVAAPAVFVGSSRRRSVRP